MISRCGKGFTASGGGVESGAKAAVGTMLARDGLSFPLQHLHVPTLRARHVEVTLIAGLEKIADSRGALDRRRAGEIELGVASERTAPGFRQLDGVALLANVDFPSVDFIAVHVASQQLRQKPQARSHWSMPADCSATLPRRSPRRSIDASERS